MRLTALSLSLIYFNKLYIMSNLTNSDKLISKMESKADRTELHTYTPWTWIDITNDEVSIDLQSWIWIAINWNIISASWMVIMKYWISTRDDFIDAYNKQMLVYCRASRESNPATWAQTRLAFMAYVDNETNPTEVEFQYLRSNATKNATTQWDEVHIYWLRKTSWWYYIKRNCYTRIVAWDWLSQTYSSWILTIENWTLQNKPDVVYETDWTTWLVWANVDLTQSPTWQLTWLDLSWYKRLKFYIKANGDTTNYLTPSMIVEMSLDSRSTSSLAYGHFTASAIAQYPNDNNRLVIATFAVSSDKTSIIFLRQTSLYWTAATSASWDWRYCYLIEWYYD